MVRLFDLQKSFVAPTKVEFAAFIPNLVVPEVLKGNIPALRRRLTVQTEKSLIARSVSTAEFLELKQKRQISEH